MTSARDIVTRHVASALEEAAAQNVPTDVVGRLLLEKAIGVWKQERSLDDIATELTNAAENIDPDNDYAFMRP